MSATTILVLSLRRGERFRSMRAELHQALGGKFRVRDSDTKKWYTLDIDARTLTSPGWRWDVESIIL